MKGRHTCRRPRRASCEHRRWRTEGERDQCHGDEAQPALHDSLPPPQRREICPGCRGDLRRNRRRPRRLAEVPSVTGGLPIGPNGPWRASAGRRATKHDEAPRRPRPCPARPNPNGRPAASANAARRKSLGASRPRWVRPERRPSPPSRSARRRGCRTPSRSRRSCGRARTRAVRGGRTRCGSSARRSGSRRSRPCPA